MTIESMINVLRYKAEHIKTKIRPEFFAEVADVLEREPCCKCIEFKRYAKDMGIEIEQEPCEDCVSRETLLAMSDYIGESPTYSNPYAELEEVVRVEDIKSLPSVQPKPKTGHWVYDGDQIICSKCHTAFGFISLKLVTNFCAECGADMRGEKVTE